MKTKYLEDERGAREAATRAARNLIEVLQTYVQEIGSDEPLGDILESSYGTRFLEIDVRGRTRIFKAAHRHLRAVYDHGDDEE